MSGHPSYPRGGYHYHMWVRRLVRPVSAATTLPSEYRNVCLVCGDTR
jgi:hypothetical protein